MAEAVLFLQQIESEASWQLSGYVTAIYGCTYVTWVVCRCRAWERLVKREAGEIPALSRSGEGNERHGGALAVSTSTHCLQAEVGSGAR